MLNQAQNLNQNLSSEQNKNQEQSPKKECRSLFTVKMLSVVLIFSTLSMIIIGGGYLIARYAIIPPNKTDLPIVNPIIEAQCKIDSDCYLVYVSDHDYICPPCDTSSENYQCLTIGEMKKLKNKGNKIDESVMCSPCPLEVYKHTCKCANGKCEKVKEELVEEVVITTDKTEYEQGENVSVIIKNNFSEEIFISYPIVERIINDNYIPLKGSVVWSGCGVTGGLIYLPLEPSEAVKHQWDQKEKWCSTDFSDRSVYSKEVLHGKYRIKSEIIKRIKSEEDDPTNVSGKSSGEFIYSNEFTIKEKSALDARCGERAKAINRGGIACTALGKGIEFSSSEGKCVVVHFSSACSVETPFKTLEECQEVCEKKIDTSNWQTYQHEMTGVKLQHPRDWKVAHDYSENYMMFNNFYLRKNFQEIEIFKSDVPPSEIWGMKLIDKKEVLVDGYKVNRELFQGKFDNNKEKYYLRVFITEKDIFYRTDFEKNDLESLPIIFDQILSTFKFIEK